MIYRKKERIEVDNGVIYAMTSKWVDSWGISKTTMLKHSDSGYQWINKKLRDKFYFKLVEKELQEMIGE